MVYINKLTKFNVNEMSVARNVQPHMQEAAEERSDHTFGANKSLQGQGAKTSHQASSGNIPLR